MNWDDIYLVTENLNLATDADVNELAEKQGSKLPEDYREFIKRFGEGTYCGYINIYHPKTVLAEYPDWQTYALRYGDGQSFEPLILFKEQWAKSLRIANTPDGDSLHIYNGEVYLLPRSGQVRKLGSSFAEALEWMLLEHPNVNHPLCNQQEYESINYRWFESWVSRIATEYELPRIKPVRFEILRAKILGLNLHRYLTGDVWHLQFYVKEIYGRVGVSVANLMPGEASLFPGQATIIHDENKENEHYQRLVGVLEELGYVLTDWKRLTAGFYSDVAY